MDFRQALNQMIVGIDATEFHIGFVDEVLRLLLEHTEQAEIPAQVIEDVTKWVENELRTMTEGFLGHELVGKAASGVGLVTAMQDSGLMLNELAQPEPIQYLLRWYVAERNIAHHSFPSYSWPTFLSFFWVSNYVLRETSRRRAKPRAVYMDIQVHPATVLAGELVTIQASLTTPTTGAPFVGGQFEARLLFSNNQVRGVSLSYRAVDRRRHRDIPDYRRSRRASGAVHFQGSGKGYHRSTTFMSQPNLRHPKSHIRGGRWTGTTWLESLGGGLECV